MARSTHATPSCWEPLRSSLAGQPSWRRAWANATATGCRSGPGTAATWTGPAMPRSDGSRPSACSLRRKYGSRSANPQPGAPPAAQPS